MSNFFKIIRVYKLRQFILLAFFTLIISCKKDSSNSKQVLNSAFLDKMEIVREERTQKTTRFSLVNLDGSAHMERTSTDDKEASRLWTQKFEQLVGLYKDHPAPYGGGITQNVSCPARYRPQELAAIQNEMLWKKGVLLYSNERKSVGVCDYQSFKLRLIYAGIYCKKTEAFFILKFFVNDIQVPTASLIKMYEEIVCKTETSQTQ